MGKKKVLAKSEGVYVGRTIGEKRERLETANERAAARKKDKLKNARRIIFVTLGFLILLTILIILALIFLGGSREPQSAPLNETPSTTFEPTIEIIDADASATGGVITNRMRQYIGQAEVDFKDLGYSPIKAVIPAGAIREVDFYLDGYSGYIKLFIDRPSAVSVEDADRLLRYLSSQGISDFQYLDVRLPGRAFWQ